MDEDPVFACNQVADWYLNTDDFLGGDCYTWTIFCHTLYIQKMVYFFLCESHETYGTWHTAAEVYSAHLELMYWGF